MICYHITVICLNLRIVFSNLFFGSLSWYQITLIFFHCCWMQNNNLDQSRFGRSGGNITRYGFRNWSSEKILKYIEDIGNMFIFICRYVMRFIIIYLALRINNAGDDSPFCPYPRIEPKLGRLLLKDGINILFVI